MYCKNCGKLLDADSQFCLHCGTQMGEAVETAAYTPEPPAAFQEAVGDQTYVREDHKKKKAPKRGLVMGIAAALVVILAALVGIFLYGGAGKNLAKQLDLGNRYLEEMDYEQAVIAFTKAIEIDPMSVDAHLGLVEAYIRQGDFETALEAAEKGYDLTGDQRLKEKIDMIESGEIFDSLGRVMKRTGYDESGNVIWWHIFTYNLKGKEASVTAYNGAGEETGRIDRTYDEEGRATNGYWFNHNEGRIGLSKYSYEGERCVRYEDYEDTEGKILSVYETYEYDANDRQIKINRYNADGTMFEYTVPEYNEKGLMVRENKYRDLGDGFTLANYETWEFDENGNCIECEYYAADGTLESYSFYEYDADGTYLGGKSFDGEGNLQYEE